MTTMTMNRTTAKLFIGELRRDTDAIENKAVATAKAITKVSAAAVAGKRLNVTDFLKKLVVPLSEVSALAYMTGLRREQLAAKRAETRHIKASAYSEALKYLARVTGANSPALARQYTNQVRSALQRLEPTLQLRLDREVNDAIAKGLPTRDAVAAISKEFTQLTEFHLETIFRTQTQLAYGAGRWKADQDAAIQEILWGYYYTTVGDDRVRPSHEALDGVTLPKDDPFWERFWVPNGWNCRCAIISLFGPEDLVHPPSVDSDGQPVEPDPGFGFNPGRV